MHVNDTFGQSMGNGIKAILPRLDYLPFKVVETIAYDPAARDLSVEVAKAKATNADFIMLVSRLNDAILLVRELVKQRWSPQAHHQPGIARHVRGAVLQGARQQVLRLLHLPTSPGTTRRRRSRSASRRSFKKQFPKESLMFHSLNVGFTFEAMMVAADAFKRAGSADGTVLADAIRKTDIAERMMVGGPIRFDAKGQNTQIASACIQNRDGRPMVVLPSTAAQMAPVFPVPDWQARG